MSLPTFNTKSPTIKRILKEASELRSNPDATLHAAPLETNLFEWHFTLRGPPSTPYASGIYHGRILLPPTYPLRPPSFRFLTPSGRFEVNREICLSISGHHEETWQPAWGIRTALWALRAFMEGGSKGQVGGMEMGEQERKRLADESRRWRCQGCGAGTNEEILQEEEKRVRESESKDDSAKSNTAREQIPDELRFGFRDEMADKQAQDKGKGKERTDTEENLIDQKRPTQSVTGPQDPGSLPSQTTPTSPAQPLRQPVPTPTTPLPPASVENGVPPWVDKAIIGVIAGLAVMVVKKIAV
ncbi:MAG: hypothetical protein Q9218_002005 [Villophora microphyllina]